MESEVLNIHLDKKIVNIKPTEWNYDFDPDEVLKIDYSNIFGEIITIPVLVNRMGLLVAEMRNYLKEQKLNLEIKRAEISKLFRNNESGAGRKKPTVQEVEDHLTLDPVVKNMTFKLFRTEQDLSKIESLYDSCRDKSFKLNNLSKNLTPKDFEKELIEGVVNGVLIEIRQKKYS